MKAPNLTIVPGWQCLTGTGERYVESKTTNGKFYRVFISSREDQPHTCDCPHFVHRGLATHFKTCKHIDETFVDVCGWNSVIGGGEPIECPDNWEHDVGVRCSICGEVGKVCPRCGGPIERVSVGV